jgi:NAD(P)-dependent dehydrogenase (short-subunit alcohol dehydrogenase family)
LENFEMDLRLTGKTVLITGGSKGIGAACAHSFANEGANLILIARNAEQLEHTAANVRARHAVTVRTLALDLRDASQFATAAEAASEVDILVNNAGDIPAGSVLKLDEAAWRHAWELKLFGYISLSRAAFRAMSERRDGVIMNVIGLAAERATFDYICGSAANAALASFTKGLGVDAHRHGVRVLGVHPPSTRTDRIEKVLRGAAEQRYGDPNQTERLIAEGIFTRPIDPEQVADAVVYLSSPRASQISGVVMNLG